MGGDQTCPDGWYFDPSGAFMWRLWNDRRWTEQVMRTQDTTLTGDVVLRRIRLELRRLDAACASGIHRGKVEFGVWDREFVARLYEAAGINAPPGDEDIMRTVLNRCFKTMTFGRLQLCRLLPRPWSFPGEYRGTIRVGVIPAGSTVAIWGHERAVEAAIDALGALPPACTNE
jgi:hypothetical protein